MPMNRMGTTCWFSLEKVFYGIRKNKNSDLATLIFRLVQERGVYSDLEAYTSHPIDEKTKKVVIENYINDDFNCSRHVKNLHI